MTGEGPARPVSPSGDAGPTAGCAPWELAVWEVGRLLVRVGPSGSVAAGREAERLDWLAGRLPCPRVVVHHDEWLVTTMPSGHPALYPERQPSPDQVPVLVGQALRCFHDLSSDDCPFERGVEGVLAELEVAASEGRIERDQLPAPYDRYEPTRLIELAREGAPAAAVAAVRAGDGPVVGHGSPDLARWYFEGGGLVEVTGVDRLGRADRHADLAALYRSVLRRFGPEALYGLVEGYGMDPDLLRLDHYILLDALQEAVSAPAGPPSDAERAPEPPDERGAEGDG